MHHWGFHGSGMWLSCHDLTGLYTKGRWGYKDLRCRKSRTLRQPFKVVANPDLTEVFKLL
jgi:hypothetical protein